jgi:hypothetical protein
METKLQIKPDYPFEKSFLIGGDARTKATCEVRPFGNDIIVVNLTKTPNVFIEL